jgi:hypothetical protein
MKIAVVNVPRLEPHRPPPGPAIIANVCKHEGHDVTAHDFNIKFFHYCRQHNVDYHSYDAVWDRLVSINEQQLKFVNGFISTCVASIVQQNYDYILISVFGFSAQEFTELLLEQLRPLTTAKIVIGGTGVGSHNLINNNDYFGQRLKTTGKVDHFIVGEGERSIVQLLRGEPGPGIDNNDFVQIEDIDQLLQPNYEFYNLNEYDYLVPGSREVYITGSRGCVRKCTYCDVERYWPKYRYRSGQNIADEIIDNYERFGIHRFYFTDSLVNGSYRAFNDMCDKLSQYKFDRPIKWSGQFIFRQQKSVPRDHFATIAAAGADILYVGLETGSDRVRFDMGKKFTNEDIAFQLEECSRNGIRVMPLMFTGYLTETLEDHYENLRFFERWQRYVADGTIIGVELGSTLTILPGAPVERMIDSHEISFLLTPNGAPDSNLWYSATNPDLTIRERIRRKLEVHEAAIRHAWPVWRQTTRLEELRKFIVHNRLDQDEDLVFHRIQTDSSTSAKRVVPIVLQSY